MTRGLNNAKSVCHCLIVRAGIHTRPRYATAAHSIIPTCSGIDFCFSYTGLCRLTITLTKPCLFRLKSVRSFGHCLTRRDPSCIVAFGSFGGAIRRLHSPLTALMMACLIRVFCLGLMQVTLSPEPSLWLVRIFMLATQTASPFNSARRATPLGSPAALRYGGTTHSDYHVGVSQSVCLASARERKKLSPGPSQLSLSCRHITFGSWCWSHPVRPFSLCASQTKFSPEQSYGSSQLGLSTRSSFDAACGSHQTCFYFSF